jgi:hypothetical protein
MPPERLEGEPLDYPCDVCSAVCLVAQLVSDEPLYARLARLGKNCMHVGRGQLLGELSRDGLAISGTALSRLTSQCRDVLLAGLEMGAAKGATAAHLLDMMPACLAAAEKAWQAAGWCLVAGEGGEGGEACHDH